MAAITTIVGSAMASLEATTAARSTILQTLPDAPYGWQLSHTGLDRTGAASTGTVAVAILSTATISDATEGLGKALLVAAGVPLFIPPGIGTIYYQSLSGSPVLNLCRSANFNGNY